MKQSLRLGRVAGITISAHWSVLAILVLVAYVLGASWLPAVIANQPAGLFWVIAAAGSLAFMAWLLAHELAHALVARHSGVEVRSITFWLLGGFTELGTDPRTPGAELRIALAGPATSMAAAALFGALAFAGGWLVGPVVVIAALGWLAISAAARVKDSLAGMRVRDIMTAELDLAPAWSSPAALIEHVVRESRRSVFPVVSIAMDVSAAYQAGPEDPAPSLLRRAPLGGELAAVVLSGGRVAGIVTCEDPRRALRMARLRGTADDRAPAGRR